MTSVDEQVRVLGAGAVDLITEADLRRKLERGTPLRVKLGIDPTASDIHLGFAVVLRKLRQFQDLGHVAVLIIGDFTAQVGDPSGKSATRPRLTKEEVDGHAQTYLEQVQRDPRLLARAARGPPQLHLARRRWTWRRCCASPPAPPSPACSSATTSPGATPAARRSRSPSSSTRCSRAPTRWRSGPTSSSAAPTSSSTTSWAATSRSSEGQEGQVVLTTPLLEGLDGVQKMSKSLGNYIGIAEPPAEQFGKLMSLPDELMPRYFLLTTGWHPDRVDEVVGELTSGALRPVEAKRLLARTVVDLYHGDGRGRVGRGRVRQGVPVPRGARPRCPSTCSTSSEAIDGRLRLATVLRQAGLVKSNKEGARKIAQGAVRLDGKVVDDPNVALAPGELDGVLLQVGKRGWARIRGGLIRREEFALARAENTPVPRCRPPGRTCSVHRPPPVRDSGSVEAVETDTSTAAGSRPPE